MRQTRRFLALTTTLATVGLIVAPSFASAQGEVMYVINDKVGIGTNAPEAPLHIKRSDGTAQLLIEEASSTLAQRDMIMFRNNGKIRMFWDDINVPASQDWVFAVNPFNSFVINKGGDANAELRLAPNGDLYILGSIYSASTKMNVPDYVFNPGYHLMPIDTLAKYVAQHRHLPGLPSKAEMEKKGKVDVTDLQMRLLKKVEELTLYTIEQQKTIDGLTRRLAALEAKQH
jgi:hypothetical protein